jgi:hypothetical protein
MEAKESAASSDEQVNLSSLAQMTGFPVDYIKSELLLAKDEVSLSELRKTMVSYLISTNEELK